MELAGTKAVVFGGTSGIGLAAVARLAQRDVEVIAISRHPERAGTLPEGVSTRACDVLDEAAVASVLEECGPYDHLISAATGGERAIGPFLEMEPSGFRASFDKVWGYANVVRFGAAHLSDRGSIVLVSGTPARRIKPGLVAIGAAGAAVESLVRSVATELVPRRINVVAPGTIDTPMNPLTGDARVEAYRRSTASNLIPRAGTADEVASAIVFCLENDFVTGTTVDVDGGWLLS